MSTKFYVGQKDYIEKLNELDDTFIAAGGAPEVTAANVAAALAAAGQATTAADDAAASEVIATDAAGVAMDKADIATAKADEAAQDAADAETARLAAVAAKSGAETANLGVEAARAAAEGFAGTATAKAGEASGSATVASNAKDAANTAAMNANTAKDSALSNANIAANASALAETARLNAVAAKDAAQVSANAVNQAASDTVTAKNTAVAAANAAVDANNNTQTNTTTATASKDAAVAAKNSADSAAAAALASSSAASTSAQEANVSAATAAVNASVASGMASTASTNAVAASTSAGQSSASAAQALAIYGTTNAMQAKLDEAKVQSQLAQTAAASASSVLQQDLSAISAALHRSPNAITAMCIMDLSKDSDGGAWADRCQHTSWYNEPLNGAWLGRQPSELNARYANCTVGAEMLADPTLDNAAAWHFTTVRYTIVGGKAVRENNANAGGIRAAVNMVAGTTYRVTVEIAATLPAFAGAATNFGRFSVVVSNFGSAPNFISAEQTGTLGETLTFYVTPSVNCNNLSIDNSSNSYSDIESVSMVAVTAQTTKSGDYFQLTTDGKHYKLNATAGITEVFRGNKAKPGRLMAVVAEAGNVTIYDLTEKGCPMWMRFVNAVGGTNWPAGNLFYALSAITGVAALNGILCVTSNSADAGNTEINFPGDYALKRGPNALYGGRYFGNIAQRNAGKGYAFGQVHGLPVIVNQMTNAVAMTVLPDAPTDVVTGLAVPTIAVATGGGVSVIKHDGVVVSNTAIGGSTSIALHRNILMVGGSGGAISYALMPGTANPLVFTGLPAYFFASYWNRISLGGRGSLATVDANSTKSVLKFAKNFEGAFGKAPIAAISNDYSTGHMLGDIRRAYLANTEVESVTGSNLVANGNAGSFDSDITGVTVSGSATISRDTSIFPSGGLKVVSGGGVGMGAAVQTFTTVVGKAYEVRASIYAPSSNSTLYAAALAFHVGGGTGVSVTAEDVVQEKYFSFTATATSHTLYALNLNVASAWGVTGDVAYFDNISLREAISDRSYKAAAATIYGTLTKSPVSPGSQLVCYSGFSS